MFAIKNSLQTTNLISPTLIRPMKLDLTYTEGKVICTNHSTTMVLLPFVIAGVVILHIWALHIPGSSNPTGVEVKSESDTVPFHPYYTAKDGFGLGLILILYSIVVFYFPTTLGHAENYIEANPLSTPALIVPEWYFYPFYAILRAFTFDLVIPFTSIVLIPAKLLGVMAMFGSICSPSSAVRHVPSEPLGSERPGKRGSPSMLPPPSMT